MIKKKNDYFIANGGKKVKKDRLRFKKAPVITSKKKKKGKYEHSNLALMCYEWD